MRAPFRDARDALVAARYECNPSYDASLMSTSTPVVFGGEAVCATCFEGGSYSDNGGRNYVTAEVELRPRYEHKPDYVQALRMAKEEHPDIVERFKRFPRSDRQARELLELAGQFDRTAAGHLEAARAIVDAAEAERVRQMQMASRALLVRRIASGVLVEEVLHLFKQGLLDDSNALKGLRDIAERMDRADRGIEDGC
jgi:hypothetical protein